jgi:hypothetical protein
VALQRIEVLFGNKVSNYISRINSTYRLYRVSSLNHGHGGTIYEYIQTAGQQTELLNRKHA